VVDKFERRRFSQIVVEAKWLEVIGIDTGNESKFHAATDDLVHERDFFSKTQRMIERNNIAHRADADFLRARGRSDHKQAGRRHPALVGPKMMFDAERVVEAERVAQLQLAPKLLVTLMRSHAWFAPDMRKMGKLHSLSLLEPRGCHFKCRPVVPMFHTLKEAVMDDKTRTELEAAVYRRLVDHL